VPGTSRRWLPLAMFAVVMAAGGVLVEWERVTPKAKTGLIREVGWTRGPLVAVDSLLSNGPGWLGDVPHVCRRQDHHGGHWQSPRSSAVTPLSESQIPTCSLYQQAMRGMNDKRGMNAARAVLVPPRILDRLEPRPASSANPRVFLSSLLEFAQLGRGPPPVS
jgi:hypothetical protein